MTGSTDPRVMNAGAAGLAASRPSPALRARRCGHLALRSMFAGMALGLLACGAARADRIEAQNVKCAVQASRSFADDYALRYSGGCSAGLAQGDGEARWVLPSSPGKAWQTWKGRFHQGVFQPAPLRDVQGRPWTQTSALFDLGDLGAAGGAAGARLYVESDHGNELPANACAPRLVIVALPSADVASANPSMQAELRRAAAELSRRCGDALAVESKDRGRPAQPDAEMKVIAQQASKLRLDSNEDMPEELASAWVPLNANRPLRQYFNRVVSARARQAQEQANADELQARLERLRAFFDKHHAEAWVPVADLAQNSYRFQGKTVVTAVELVRVLAPGVAGVSGSRYPMSGNRNDVIVVQGDEVSRWSAGDYIVALVPTGRSIQGAHGDFALARLVAAERCASEGCWEWLQLPRYLEPGRKP